MAPFVHSASHAPALQRALTVRIRVTPADRGA